MSEEYYLKIHGHSCLELKAQNTAILFDPWLNGSAYWRSWWNFPEPESLDEIIKSLSKCNQIYIYITHLHWDHFHGPTLRKIYKELPNSKFLISRVPEKRLKNDLIKVLNSNINVLEINHAAKYKINSKLSLKPFLSGPILTDSAVLIQNGNDLILNLNDSKLQTLMMSQIISSIGDGNLKVMLRSHSSANSRVCIRNRDGSEKQNTDKKKDSYSKEFLNIFEYLKPKMAIPFASNMCYLHKDSMQYNAFSNTSDELYHYYLSQKKYSDNKVQLVLPGEKLDLNTLEIYKSKSSREQLFANREKELKRYRKKFIDKLNKSEEMQDKTLFSEKIIVKYFQNVFSILPFYIRFFGRGKLAFLDKNMPDSPDFFIVDLYRKKIFFNNSNLEDCHTIIKVSPGVLNNALVKKNLNSLGISKLLEIHTSSVYKYNYFFAFCIWAEIGSIPFTSIKQFIRSADIWIRRWREILNYIYIVLRIKKLNDF